MRRVVMALTVLSCFVAATRGQEQEKPKFSGRFDYDGRRLEERAQSFRSPEPGTYEKECKTIAEWAELVKGARSRKFRLVAASTLWGIANRDSGDRRNPLTTAEADELRKTCLGLCTAEEDTVRLRIVNALGPIADPSCVPTFNKLLQDPDAQICYDTLKVLGRIGDDSSVKAIVAFIDNIPGKRNGDYYGYAIQALTRIGSPAARTVLEEMYQDAKDPKLKELTGAALDELDLKK